MSHDRITVIRGGPNRHHRDSLREGLAIENSLKELGFDISDLVITKTGEWIENGLAKSPDMIISATDKFFIALRGEYGEDGQIQKIFETYRIPFSGSRSLPSATAYNKHFTKQILKNHGFKLPHHQKIHRSDIPLIATMVSQIYAEFGPEYIVKPTASGSSLDIVMVREGQSLAEAIKLGLSTSDSIIVEEYIRGREANVIVLDNYRNQEHYAFPAVEVVLPKNYDIYTTDLKRNSKLHEHYPGNFSFAERTKLQEMAQLAHSILGLRNFSRSDFIVKNGEVYFLEINTHPDLTNDSSYALAANSVGLSYNVLLSHLVECID